MDEIVPEVDEYGLPLAPEKTNDTAATLATLPDNNGLNDVKHLPVVEGPGFY